jgi:hypothetical protein
MNQRIEKNTPIKGNPAVIEEMSTTILKLIGMYLDRVPVTMLDYFLSINNVHKLVIADLATRWAKDSHPEEETYRMADRMFRASIKEMIRALPDKLPAMHGDAGVTLLGEESSELLDGEETIPGDTPEAAVAVDPVIPSAEPTL